MKFIKYHGLGNNFVLVDDRGGNWSKDPEWVKLICDVNKGVGADGILYVQNAQDSENDFRMQIINSDGSEAEMCGNGIRCFAKYIVDYALSSKEELRIETLAGVMINTVHKGAGGDVEQVTVDMGKPELTGEKGETLEANGETYEFTSVSMGNPHAVIFRPITVEEAERIGPGIETHSRFPDRTNVEFLNVLGPTEADLIVFERGCGITQACGTGTCAAVYAGVLHEKFETQTPIQVHLLGGDLYITLKQDHSSILMKGPAVEVYTAELKEALL